MAEAAGVTDQLIAQTDCVLAGVSGTKSYLYLPPSRDRAGTGAWAGTGTGMRWMNDNDVAGDGSKGSGC